MIFAVIGPLSLNETPKLSAPTPRTGWLAAIRAPIFQTKTRASGPACRICLARDVIDRRRHRRENGKTGLNADSQDEPYGERPNGPTPELPGAEEQRSREHHDKSGDPRQKRAFAEREHDRDPTEGRGGLEQQVIRRFAAVRGDRPKERQDRNEQLGVRPVPRPDDALECRKSGIVAYSIRHRMPMKPAAIANIPDINCMPCPDESRSRTNKKKRIYSPHSSA